MDVHLREHPIPGSDRSHEVRLPDGAHVALIERGAEGRRDRSATAAGRDCPEIVEDDPSRLLQTGDRLVVAARPDELDAVRRRLGAR